VVRSALWFGQARAASLRLTRRCAHGRNGALHVGQEAADLGRAVGEDDRRDEHHGVGYDARMSEIITTAEQTALEQPKRATGRPFKPGQSGNPAGRPKGARSRLSENFLSDLHQCWERRGVAALEACAPEVLVKVVAGLLPKHVDINARIGVNAASTLANFRAAVTALGNPEPKSLPNVKVIDAD
jgi:Family of unknown function (DUF5681)